MIGLVLALIVVGIVFSLVGLWIFSIPIVVVGIVFSLVGLWIFSIPIVVVALILFVFFVLGWGRRTAPRSPDTPA